MNATNDFSSKNIRNCIKRNQGFFYDNDYTLWRDNLQYIDTQEKIDLVFSSDEVDDRLLDYIYRYSKWLEFR